MKFVNAMILLLLSFTTAAHAGNTAVATCNKGFTLSLDTGTGDFVAETSQENLMRFYAKLSDEQKNNFINKGDLQAGRQPGNQFLSCQDETDVPVGVYLTNLQGGGILTALCSAGCADDLIQSTSLRGKLPCDCPFVCHVGRMIWLKCQF
jgi:hypothetical protein